MQIRPDASLTFERERALPGGSVEIVYAVGEAAAGAEAREERWVPKSQR